MGLQFRRGTDSDRLGITPDIGEPLYTTDDKKLYIGDGSTAGGVLVSGDISDSASVTGVINDIVDSAFVQARQVVGPDNAAVENIVISTVDSAYIRARQDDIFRDSAFVTDIIDTAYIQARDRIRDSGFVEDIVDSAFVQARQITYDFLDSAEAINLIDSAYINARTDANIDSVALIAVVDSAYINARTDANIDSVALIAVVDSAYVQARQTDFVELTDLSVTTDGVASGGGSLNYNTTTGVFTFTPASIPNVTNIVDSAYVQSRQTAQDFAYSSLTGAPTNVSSFTNDAGYTTYDSSNFSQQITAGSYATQTYVTTSVDSAIDELVNGAPLALDTLNELATALQNDSDALAALTLVVDTKLNTAGVTSLVDSSYVQARQTAQDFAYSSLTGVPTTVSTFTNDANYLDSTTVQGVIDATYIQANQTTYDFLDSAEAIALIATQGYLTDALDSAETIALITGSDLDMGGNKVLFGNVYSNVSDLPNASTYHGMFAHVHSTGAGYFAHSGNWVRLANQSEIFSGSYNDLTDTPELYDSADTLALIDSAYIQARQSPGTDSAAVTNLIDSAYINARVDAVSGTDSAATIALIEATVDSAYIALREANADGGGLDSAAVLDVIPDATLQGVNQFEFLGDSGQTVFTGADRDGNSLEYNATDVLVFLNGTLMVPGNDFLTTNSNTITFTQGVDSGDFVTVFNFTAGRAVGGGVSEVNHFDFTADSGQTAFSGTDDNGSILSFIGNDNIQVFVNGILLKQTDYSVSNNNTITLTDGADSADEVRIIAYDTYSQRVAVDTYNYTADSGQTVFTGVADDGNTLVFSPGNLQVHLNGIMLRSGNDFTTSGTGTVTLVSGADSGDTLTVTAISGDSSGYVTIVPAIVDSAYINARVTIPDAGTDSADVVSIITAEGFTKYDSADTLELIDSAYIQTRQITYDVLDSANVNSLITSYGYTTYDSANTTGMLSSYATQSYVTTSVDSAIDALVNGAPLALDTLNELAVALQDDSDALAALTTVVDTKLNTAGVTSLIDSAYVQARQILQDFAYSSLTGAPTNLSDFTNNTNYLDSTTVTGVIDATYIQTNQITYNTSNFTDSAFVTGLPVSTFTNDTNYLDSSTATVLIDSAYINARTDANIDSVALIALVDSAYVQARQSPGTDSSAVTSLITTTVDSAYVNARVSTVDSDQVLNIVELDGYSKLDSAAALNLVIDGTYRGLRTYTFTADSGDTAFTGTDDFGNTLTYSRQALVVYVNGILLTDSVDYTALDGSTITLTNPADSADVITFHNIVAGGTDSALINQLISSYVDSAYIQSNQITYNTSDFADSAFVTGLPVSTFTNDANYLDSTTVQGVIDATYIQANQITYNTSDFADSAFVTAQINALVDGAPTTLNTLNEIAAALNDDDSAYATLVNLIGTKTDFDSADAIALIDSAHVQARQTPQDFAYSSLTGAPTTVSTFTNDANYLDSTTVTGVIDASYIQANQTIYDFLDSAEAIALITGSDLDMGTNKILYSNVYDSTGALPNASTYHGMFAHVHATGAGYFAHAGSWTQLANYSSIPTNNNQLTNGAGYTTYDSTNTLGLIDSAYINARVDAVAGTDSAATIALIQSTVDSAYVALREANAGASGGTDSATVIALIQATVDSAYVTARDPGGTGGVTFKTFQFEADSGQTTFTGADDLGNSLAFVPDQYQVYRNGILLIDSDDYNGTGGGTVTLTDTSVLGDQITIATYTATVGSSINTYDYFADSGQTSFSGADIDGNTLSFTGSNVLVHVNGLLLTDSNDYTRVGGSTITFDNGLDSGDIVSIIAVTDAVSSSGTDSATVVTLIEGTVDSAYIAARSAPGTDSATVQSIVQDLVDSAYVQARQSNTTGLLVDTYSYTADSAQTVFSGADNASNTLQYIAGDIQVFRNGILLVDSDDYTASNGTSITLTSGANTGDNLSVTAFSSADQVVQLNTFEYTADSGATSFSGTDDFGNSLTYNVGNILVHLNGILLTDSADYTANNGTTITLSTAADSADILHISAFGTATALNKWREATTSYTTEAGTKLIVDTSSGAITVTLPASPVFGDEVKIIDGTGNAGTNNITINRNSNKILGADSDFTLDVDRAAIDLVYYNAAQGWIVSGNS